MTVKELDHIFRINFGFSNQWPKTYEVDADTYGNVCQHIFSNNALNIFIKDELGFVQVAIGPNNGIMFRNVELVLVR